MSERELIPTDPYLETSSQPEEPDYGRLVSFVSNAANTTLRDNIGAVAFNATKYFAAGLYGSPEITEDQFNEGYVSTHPELSGKWKKGMRWLQADFLADDAEAAQNLAITTGSNVGSAFAGGLVAGVATDPFAYLTMGMSGIGGIAKGTSALATVGRGAQKLGRFLGPNPATNANFMARAGAGARQGIVEFAASEPLAYIVQDQYLNQERDVTDLYVSGLASVLLPTTAHALARSVGVDPLNKRDAALKPHLIQNELDPSSVDPAFAQAYGPAARGARASKQRFYDRVWGAQAIRDAGLREQGLAESTELILQDDTDNALKRFQNLMEAKGENQRFDQEQTAKFAEAEAAAEVDATVKAQKLKQIADEKEVVQSKRRAVRDELSTFKKTGITVDQEVYRAAVAIVEAPEAGRDLLRSEATQQFAKRQSEFVIDTMPSGGRAGIDFPKMESEAQAVARKFKEEAAALEASIQRNVGLEGPDATKLRNNLGERASRGKVIKTSEDRNTVAELITTRDRLRGLVFGEKGTGGADLTTAEKTDAEAKIAGLDKYIEQFDQKIADIKVWRNYDTAVSEIQKGAGTAAEKAVAISKIEAPKTTFMPGRPIDSTTRFSEPSLTPNSRTAETRALGARREASADLSSRLYGASTTLTDYISGRKKRVETQEGLLTLSKERRRAENEIRVNKGLSLLPEELTEAEIKGNSETYLSDTRLLGNLVTLVERWSGRKVRFYGGAEAELFKSPHGATTIATPDTIYINGDQLNVGTIMHTVGHEIHHTLVYKNPAMAQAIERVVMTMKASGASIGTSLEDWGPNFNQIPAHMRGEELTANSVGQLFRQPEFYARLQKELGKTTFDRIIKYITDRYDDLRRLMGQDGVGKSTLDELFDPVYKAISATKEGNAWFEGPLDLEAYRKNHWQANSQKWSSLISNGYAYMHRLDDAHDKFDAEFSVQLPDEAGDVSSRKVVHNNTEFSSTPMSVKLSPQLIKQLKANPGNREVLKAVYEAALKLEANVTSKAKTRIDKYKESMGFTEAQFDSGFRRNAIVYDIQQWKDLIEATDTAVKAEQNVRSVEGLVSSTSPAFTKQIARLESYKESLRNAEAELKGYDEWAESKRSSERPMFAWQLAGDKLVMMAAKAPVVKVYGTSVNEFSRAYHRAAEIVNEFNIHSREYDGGGFDFQGAEGRNNLTKLAETLDGLAVYVARTLSGAKALELDDTVSIPMKNRPGETFFGDKAFKSREKRNTAPVLDDQYIDSLAEQIKADPDMAMLSSFIQSREFSDIFSKDVGSNKKDVSSIKKDVDSSKEANQYFATFMEAINAFSNRKRNELQIYQDPDLLATFEAWDDRMKAFSQESGRFTKHNPAIYELKERARVSRTVKSDIEEALAGMQELIESFQKAAKEDPSRPLVSGSAADAADELRSQIAAQTGESPADITPTRLLDQPFDFESRVPGVVASHYIDTGKAAKVVSQHAAYGRHTDVAGIRAFWNDLTGLTGPMSVVADMRRKLEDGLDELSVTADRLSQDLESLNAAKARYSSVGLRQVPKDLLEAIETKTADLADLRSQIVSAHADIKSASSGVDAQFTESLVTREGMTMTPAQHTALEVLLNQGSEVSAFRFLSWEKVGLLESFDKPTQKAIKDRYQAALEYDRRFDDPKIITFGEAEDVEMVGGRVLTNNALDEADEAIQQGADFGDYQIDTMPPSIGRIQDERIAQMGDYAAPDAARIAAQFDADMPSLMGVINRLAVTDINIRAAERGITREVDYGRVRTTQVNNLISPAEWSRTVYAVTNGIPAHTEAGVNNIIERAVNMHGGRPEAITQIQTDLRVYNTQLVRRQTLNAYARSNLLTRAGTLEDLKTLMDGVSRLRNGDYIARANFANTTRQVNGSIDAELKTARLEAVAALQTAINELPIEARVSQTAGAAALKAALNSVRVGGTDPAFTAVFDAMNRGIEYARGRMNRAGAMVAKVDGFFMSQKHSLARISQDATGWTTRMMNTTNWNTVARRTGQTLATESQRTAYLDGMLNDLRNAGIQGDTVAWDVELDNLASRDRFHRTHEFLTTDDAVDYDMAFGSGDTLNEVTNQIAHRAERAVAMETFGPDYVANFDLHLAHLRGLGAPARGGVRGAFSEWSFTRARHTFEHLTGILNNPVNQRVASVGQTVRMLSSAAFGWMTTPSSITDLSHMRAALRSMGAQRHMSFVQALTDFATNSSKYDPGYRALLESTGGAISTHLSAAARGDVEFAGKGLSRRGNDAIYTANLQRRWVRNAQMGFADIFVRHLANMADDLARNGRLDETFAAYGKFYDMKEADLLAISRHIEEVDTDGSGTMRRVLMPASISDPRLRAKFQGMLVDTMDHAVLQPSASDTAFLTFGTRAGTVTGEIVRTMMQFRGFSMAMNVRMRRRYRLYGMSELQINRMNVDRLYHGASLLAMGLLATQIKDSLNGKEPLHFMNEDQWTASNVHRVFMQAGLFTVLSDLGLDVDYKEDQGLRASVGSQLFGPAIGQMGRFGSQVLSDNPNGGNRAITTLLNSTPGATIPVWNSLKRELFGQMIYEAYGIYLDGVVARQQQITGQTQLINIPSK